MGGTNAGCPSRWRQGRLGGALSGGLAFLVVVAASPSRGATFVVDSTADEVDANPGDGACASAAGACTLRAAIQEANALVGVDEVNVPAGTYQLALAGQDEDAAATGDLDVTETISIAGAGAGSTVIDAVGIDRIFDLRVEVQVSGLTLTGADLPAPEVGGAVRAVTGFTATSCTFAQNRAEDGATAWRNSWPFDPAASPMTFDQCLFESNTGTYSVVDGGNSRLVIRRCTFRSNVGRAVQAAHGATITDSLFEDNLAGGAVSASGDLTVRDTTFLRNESHAGGAIAFGGFEGRLLITGSRFHQNRSNDVSGWYGGGAIYLHYDASGFIEDSTFTENHANFDGGAIAVDQSYEWGYDVTLRRVTITGCTAGGSGGAIDIGLGNTKFQSTIRILDSSLSGNHADVSGGAIFAGGASPSVPAPLTVLVNSTLSSNSAPRGGAIALEEGGTFSAERGGHVVALNATIAFNDAAVAAGVDAPDMSVAEMGRSILFGSTGGPDCEGTLVSLGHNVFGTAAPCALAGDTSTDLLGVDPLLGPLQDNGGPTFTHELLAGSPAIEAALDTCADETGSALWADQRGEPRRFDGDGDGIADCDIGAFEAGCGADSDGDGLGDGCDCAPADPTTMRVPVEADLRVRRDAATGEAIVSWQDLRAEAGTGTLHDVASDTIGALWGRRVADASCVATGVAGPWPDSRPVTDGGWYYLVRGVNACGPPSGQGWGQDSLGTPRPTCP